MKVRGNNEDDFSYVLFNRCIDDVETSQSFYVPNKINVLNQF